MMPCHKTLFKGRQDKEGPEVYWNGGGWNIINIMSWLSAFVAILGSYVYNRNEDLYNN